MKNKKPFIVDISDDDDSLDAFHQRPSKKRKEPFPKDSENETFVLPKDLEELKERETRVNEKEQAIESTMKDLAERQERWDEWEKKISSTTTIESKLGKNQVIRLNIGGKMFATNLSTLHSIKDTFFTAYFNDYFNPTPEEHDQAFFIDRPFELFNLILNYLRGIDIKPRIHAMKENDLLDFIEEVVYYQITPIYDLLPQKGKNILVTKYNIQCEGNITAFTQLDPEFCSSNILLESPTRAKKVGRRGWDCVLGFRSTSFNVKLITNCTNMFIGFAPRTVKLNEDDTKHHGSYLYTGNGSLWGQNGDMNKNFLYHSEMKEKTIISGLFKEGNISFSVNGGPSRVAYSNIPSEPELFPAFYVFFENCVFELVN